MSITVIIVIMVALAMMFHTVWDEMHNGRGI